MTNKFVDILNYKELTNNKNVISFKFIGLALKYQFCVHLVVITI